MHTAQCILIDVRVFRERNWICDSPSVITTTFCVVYFEYKNTERRVIYTGPSDQAALSRPVTTYP